MAVIPSEIDYFVFADFSGDAGTKIGASSTMTFAWVVVRREDYAIVESAVFEAKRMLSMKLSEELKYRTLRKHKRRNEALELLAAAPARIQVLHRFKEDGSLRNEDIAVANVLPVTNILEWIGRNGGKTNTSIQFVYDMTKWKETDPLTEGLFRQVTQVPNTDIKFAQSGRFALLQYADIVSGYFREYFEFLSGSMQVPPCLQCIKGFPSICHYRRSRKFPAGFTLFRKWFSQIIENARTARCYYGYYCIPPDAGKRLRFLDCVIFGK